MCPKISHIYQYGKRIHQFSSIHAGLRAKHTLQTHDKTFRYFMQVGSFILTVTFDRRDASIHAASSHFTPVLTCNVETFMAQKPILATVERRINMRHDITPATKLELINEIHHDLFGKKADPDRLWNTMITRLRQDRAGLNSNRKRWADDLTPVYEAYIHLLDTALVRINGARLRYTTIAEAQAEAYKRNRTRVARGDLHTGSCGTAWQTWIPPHLIKELLDRQEQTYNLRGAEPSRGKRASLFVSQNLRLRVTKHVKQVYASLANLRRIMRTDGLDSSNPHANTPYRALYLAAVRQAELNMAEVERELKRGIRPYWDAKIPVNWRALLEPEMRARLRAADGNPQAVDISGLQSFYKSPEYGESVEVVSGIDPDDGDDSTVSPSDDDSDSDSDNPRSPLVTRAQDAA